MRFVLVALFLGVAYAQHSPEENIGVDDPNLFEGDMILTDEQRLAARMGLDVDAPSTSARKGIRNRRWPGGVVVYTIDNSLRRNDRAMKSIREGMKMWTDNTCIRFKERTNEYAYAHFYQGRGCSSMIGRTGRMQRISLGARGGCWIPAVVAHEIGHALGFYHEQSRPDRDEYVTIHWNNIISNMKFNFNKYPRSTIDSLGVPYDYNSVMHYHGTAFSRNRRATITAKQSGVRLGNYKNLSKNDIKLMNLMYECSGGGGGGGGGGVEPPPPPPPPPPPGNCKDTGRYCSYHVPRGDCKRMQIVREKCRKSCGLC
ncbi:blastula protease 10 [Exaiptasia diaphana]|uniref:Metalloendopeptidase n=1 Tax=Exaiptasia diaphana TaxID=2652724 RepID=A0A913Y7H2_EXADI|nr:blastula protease 10 [Exaiptasia diaphana]